MTDQQQQQQQQLTIEEETEETNEPPLNRRSTTDALQVTFLEPNIDLISNYSYKTPAHSDTQYKSPSFSTTNIYYLEVIEQPHYCRLSSGDEKDRRPIDPAPIVRLTVFDFDKTRLLGSESESPFYIIHVSLWSSDMTTRHDIVENSYPVPLKCLIGQLVSSSTLLKDMENEKGYYFAFPDLSVRMTGEYRLLFSLVHLAVNKVITEVFSEPFVVVPAKNFPGMRESSEISRHLAKQGLKLTIRTLVRGKKEQ